MNTSNGPADRSVGLFFLRYSPLSFSWLTFVLLAVDIGSAGTTMVTVEAFVTAMITHPEVQSKAQAEIDRVIGADRLPKLTECVYSNLRSAQG